jgi:hypothetical protein
MGAARRAWHRLPRSETASSKWSSDHGAGPRPHRRHPQAGRPLVSSAQENLAASPR